MLEKNTFKHEILSYSTVFIFNLPTNLKIGIANMKIRNKAKNHSNKEQ